ncbi:MAG: DUF3305 domain-containing protein [Candidatus Thiodiazotropha sp.]
MTLQSVDDIGRNLPDQFAVSLVVEESPPTNPWLDIHWEPIGILVDSRPLETESAEPALIHTEGDTRRFLQRGFSVRLHVDECESYYHNLLAPSPCCYLVVTPSDQGAPRPLLITLSFDEAHAYLEGEEDLYTLPMPAEVYQWTEAFVLAHYVPVKRTKRQRQDWRKPGREAAT